MDLHDGRARAVTRGPSRRIDHDPLDVAAVRSLPTEHFGLPDRELDGVIVVRGQRALGNDGAFLGSPERSRVQLDRPLRVLEQVHNRPAILGEPGSRVDTRIRCEPNGRAIVEVDVKESPGCPRGGSEEGAATVRGECIATRLEVGIRRDVLRGSAPGGNAEDAVRRDLVAVRYLAGIHEVIPVGGPCRVVVRSRIRGHPHRSRREALGRDDVYIALPRVERAAGRGRGEGEPRSIRTPIEGATV